MNDLYYDARRLYEAGKFSETIALLRPVLEQTQSMDNEREILLLANAYDETGQHAEALELLQSVLALHEDSAEAWNNIGIICQKLEREEEAQEAFERAYRFDPENPQYLINLGALHLKRGDLAAAMEHLQLALKLEAAHPLAHANMAIVMAMFGRLEEAEESLRLAVLYGFNNPDPIQDRINKLRAIRQDILDAQQNAIREMDSSSANGEDDPRQQLAAKERLIRSLVKRRYDQIHYESEEHDQDLDGQIAAIRMEIREQRKAFDLPEVSEDDMFMGENYMVTPEERAEDGEDLI